MANITLNTDLFGTIAFDSEDGLWEYYTIEMDGKEISTISDISTLVKSHNVGDTITFSVYRNGRLIEVTATCYEYTPNIQFEK
jgi:tricorn protease-like protein